MTCAARLPVAVLAAGLLAVLASGCDNDQDICSPPVPAARLSGHVRTGGDPTDMTLLATRVDLAAGYTSEFSAAPDANGAYAIDVPPGRYILKLNWKPWWLDYFYAASGPAYGTLPPDTIQVDTGRIYGGLDFDLGTLGLHISLADSSLDGESVLVLLHLDSGDGATWNDGYQWSESVTIAGDSADLEAVGELPGRYQVELVLGYRLYGCGFPWDGEHIWLPDAENPEHASWYEINAGSRLDLVYAPHVPSAHLAGRIGGAWLELGMSPAPELSLIGTDSVAVMGRRRVNDDGSFALDLYHPRPVKLLASQKDMSQYFGGPDFASATVYDLAPGDSRTGIEIAPCAVVLDPSMSLSGIDGSPLFEIYDPTGSTLLGTVNNYNTIKSTYILPNLWPGEFLVRLVPGEYDRGRLPWVPQWLTGTTDQAEAEHIVLTQDGEILPLAMTVLEGGQIKGRILNAPDPNAFRYVLVTRSDSRDIWGTNYASRPALKYTLMGLPDGDYRIGNYLVFTDGDTIWYPGTTDWNSAGIIEIVGAEIVTGVDIPVP